MDIVLNQGGEVAGASSWTTGFKAYTRCRPAFFSEEQVLAHALKLEEEWGSRHALAWLERWFDRQRCLGQGPRSCPLQWARDKRRGPIEFLRTSCVCTSLHHSDGEEISLLGRHAGARVCEHRR